MTLLKGALVEFTPTFLVPLPNVIVFQYNPETMTHTWTQPDRGRGTRAASRPATRSRCRACRARSSRSTIAIDANEDIADGSPVSAQLAEVTGVYTRLAALEMLLYPPAATRCRSCSGPAVGGARARRRRGAGDAHRARLDDAGRACSSGGRAGSCPSG